MTKTFPQYIVDLVNVWSTLASQSPGVGNHLLPVSVIWRKPWINPDK